MHSHLTECYFCAVQHSKAQCHVTLCNYNSVRVVEKAIRQEVWGTLRASPGQEMYYLILYVSEGSHYKSFPCFGGIFYLQLIGSRIHFPDTDAD